MGAGPFSNDVPEDEGRRSRTLGGVVEMILRSVVALVALSAVGAVVAVVAARASFPYPLEWMEGGMVLHVRRVLHGDPLYVQPSLSFTPFVYPPLYVYASAAVASVTGIGFLPLRLVSVLSTAGCGAVIALLVHRETGRPLASATAVGLFAGTYPLVDTWFDLARVDMLFVLFALVTLAVLRFGRGRAAGVAAGILFVLAALTKQSALLGLAPVAVYLALADRRIGLPFVATAGGLLAAVTVGLQVESGGWFLYYVLTLPTGHEILPGRLVEFWTDAILPVGIAAAVGFGFLLLEHRRRPRIARFYAFATVGFVGATLQAWLHSGGWTNVLVPTYAIVAILFGLGVDRVTGFLTRLSNGADRPSPAAVRSGLLLVVLLQFVALGYAPADHVPTAADRERAEALEQDIESLDEPAFSPIFPYLAVRAGHESVAHKMALVDVLRAPPHDARSTLRTEVERTMRTDRYDSLALHHREHELAPFARGYRYDRPLGEYDPVAGVDVTPRYVFVPARGGTTRIVDPDDDLRSGDGEGVSAVARWPSPDSEHTPAVFGLASTVQYKTVHNSSDHYKTVQRPLPLAIFQYRAGQNSTKQYNSVQRPFGGS